MIQFLKVIMCMLISSYVLVLSACGQKGDLYLPDIPPPPKVVETPQAPEVIEENQPNKRSKHEANINLLTKDVEK